MSSMRAESRPISSGHDVVAQVAGDGQLAAVSVASPRPVTPSDGGDPQGHEVAARRGDQHLGAFNLAHRSHSLGRSGHPARTRV